jgi:hypothetical protein
MITLTCLLTSSFPFACRDGNGGAQEFKVKVFDSTLSGITETSGRVTMTGAALTGWYTLYCEKMTSNAGSAGATSVQNGTTTYKETAVFIYNKLQASFRNELKAYHQQRVHIAVKDNNGTSWLFGFTRGMDLPSSTSTTGTNYEDRSGYTLTFEGTEPNPIVEITNYAALVTA